MYRRFSASPISRVYRAGNFLYTATKLLFIAHNLPHSVINFCSLGTRFNWEYINLSVIPGAFENFQKWRAGTWTHVMTIQVTDLRRLSHRNRNFLNLTLTVWGWYDVSFAGSNQLSYSRQVFRPRFLFPRWRWWLLNYENKIQLVLCCID